MKSCAVNIGLGEFVAQHQREYAVLGGFDCCTCGWTVHDGSGCATYEEHVEAAWLQARTRLARGDKPDETTTFAWFCEVCGNHFHHHGITSVCQRCTDAGIEELRAGGERRMTDRGRAWVQAEWGPAGRCDNAIEWGRSLIGNSEAVVVRGWPFRAWTGFGRRIEVAAVAGEFL